MRFWASSLNLYQQSALLSVMLIHGKFFLQNLNDS